MFVIHVKKQKVIKYLPHMATDINNTQIILYVLLFQKYISSYYIKNK